MQLLAYLYKIDLNFVISAAKFCALQRDYEIWIEKSDFLRPTLRPTVEEIGIIGQIGMVRGTSSLSSAL